MERSVSENAQTRNDEVGAHVLKTPIPSPSTKR